MLEFIITVRECGPHERDMIERISDDALGSDHCVGVFLGSRIIGWGDDYGTFWTVPHEGTTVRSELKTVGEDLLAAAVKFYETCTAS